MCHGHQQLGILCCFFLFLFWDYKETINNFNSYYYVNTDIGFPWRHQFSIRNYLILNSLWMLDDELRNIQKKMMRSIIL